MSSAKRRTAFAIGAALLSSMLVSCATSGGGMSEKTSAGIPMGKTSPHPVQPLADKPRKIDLYDELSRVK